MNGAFVDDRIEQEGNGTDIHEIELHVQDQVHGKIPDLRLLKCGKGLVLKGHAHTFYAKQVAQHAVMKATDLPILKNEIDVC